MSEGIRQHKIVFVNGPKKSGKDTAAIIATGSGCNIRHAKYSARLKHMAREMFRVPFDMFNELEKSGNNDLKDMPQTIFYGMSWRQLLIWLSEEVMKPKFGDDIFGKWLRDDLVKPTLTKGTIISDCGFYRECGPVIKTYGAENCYLLRLHRPGCDFIGDSRSYIELPELPAANVIDIQNRFELPLFKVQVLKQIDKIFGVVGREY